MKLYLQEAGSMGFSFFSSAVNWYSFCIFCIVMYEQMLRRFYNFIVFSTSCILILVDNVTTVCFGMGADSRFQRKHSLLYERTTLTLNDCFFLDNYSGWVTFICLFIYLPIKHSLQKKLLNRKALLIHFHDMLFARFIRWHLMDF